MPCLLFLFSFFSSLMYQDSSLKMLIRIQSPIEYGDPNLKQCHQQWQLKFNFYFFLEKKYGCLCKQHSVKFWQPMVLRSVSDPHWLNADPDPAFYTNADPDSVRIRILIKIEPIIPKANKRNFFYLIFLTLNIFRPNSLPKIWLHTK
jgi:hypothetical protein